MLKTLLGLTCLLTLPTQAFEYDLIFENEHMTVARVVILPYEEIGFHRDEFPQIVTAVQGGTITRLEEDGSTSAVFFPTGKTVYRLPDPENQFHRSVNISDDPIELVVVQIKTH